MAAITKRGQARSAKSQCPRFEGNPTHDTMALDQVRPKRLNGLIARWPPPRAQPTQLLEPGSNGPWDWPYIGPGAARISRVNAGESAGPCRMSCRARQQVRGSVVLAPKRRSGTLTRKRSLVQIQYGPPGISCSWPYKVALCGPTTGPTARAKDMPRSQAHGYRRGRAQAQIWPRRHAWERFMAAVALNPHPAQLRRHPGQLDDPLAARIRPAALIGTTSRVGPRRQHCRRLLFACSSCWQLPTSCSRPRPSTWRTGSNTA